MFKIVGFKARPGGNYIDKSTGEMKEAKAKIIFYTLNDITPSVNGLCAGELPVNQEDFPKISGTDNPFDLVNKEVRLLYIPMGRYQLLSEITIV